jgi:hypothetical protein
MCFYHAKDGKAVTIYMLLWTHQVQTLKELDFFLHIPYIILIPLIIFHVIIILLFFSNGDLFFIYSVSRRLFLIGKHNLFTMQTILFLI